MGAVSATTFFELAEGRSKLDQLFLHGSGNKIFSYLETTANECVQLITRLQERKDVDPNKVLECAAPLNDLLGNSQVLRDNLFSVDGRVERAARESTSLRGWRELLEKVSAAQKSGDQAAIEQFRSELTARHRRLRDEQYRMLPDMKASLRYRLLLLRRWRSMLNIELALYDLLIEDLKRSIERLTGGAAPDEAPWSRETSPPDDSVPESPDEIQALIVSEARDLEELLKRKEKLERLLKELETTEKFVSTELDNQVRRFAKEEPPTEEEKIPTRIVYRPENRKDR